jgi:3-hydroxyisobutyrate dehydrogenase-like beta-hydroxyacid dehydrogenase
MRPPVKIIRLNKVEAFMLSDAFNSGFSLSLMKKDLETAHRFIQQVDAESGFASDCLQVWQSCRPGTRSGRRSHRARIVFIKDSTLSYITTLHHRADLPGDRSHFVRTRASSLLLASTG